MHFKVVIVCLLGGLPQPKINHIRDCWILTNEQRIQTFIGQRESVNNYLATQGRGGGVGRRVGGMGCLFHLLLLLSLILLLLLLCLSKYTGFKPEIKLWE